MSFALPRTGSAGSGRNGQRSGHEAAKTGSNQPTADQDYVLVEEADQASDAAAAKPAARGSASPAPVQVELEVPMPELMVETPSPGTELQLDTEALLAFRARHPRGKATSVHSDRTDYSGLNDATAGGEDDLHKALEEANQQHQWAMEAVIRGWESEKADLLHKLGDMTESRDALETELKHREANFAGLMEGILDQKLDQMLLMLQDYGAKPNSSRGSLSSPSAVYSQPTVRKAQQVVHDLGALLEATKMQQTAIEARVTTMQSTIMQLLPDMPNSARGPSPHTAALPMGGSHQPDRCGGKREALKQTLSGVGSFCNRTRCYVADKVPKAVHATGSLAAKAITTPVHFVGRHAAGLNQALKERGVKHEHVTAAAGAAAGIVATTLLVKVVGGRGRGRAGDEWNASNVREIEVMGPETSPEDGAVVVVNRNRALKRGGIEEPALVIAWPV